MNINNTNNSVDINEMYTAWYQILIHIRILFISASYLTEFSASEVYSRDRQRAARLRRFSGAALSLSNRLKQRHGELENRPVPRWSARKLGFFF